MRKHFQPKDGSIGVELILTDEQEVAKKKAIQKSPNHEKLTPVLIKTLYGSFVAYYSHDAEKRAEKLKAHYEEQMKRELRPVKR